MPTTDQKTRAWLDFLEREARQNPALHKFRLLIVALFGYAYPLFLLLLTLALVIGLLAAWPLAWNDPDARGIFIYAMIVIAVLVLAATIVRSFFVSMPEPGGPTLGETDAPALRELIEEVRETLDAPPIHRIHVDIQFNAAVAQRSRFGFWGDRTNHLLLGLPMLLAITPEQLRLVLAHEMAHLRGEHNRFSAWVYRIQKTWQTLAVAFKTRKRQRLLMGWFVRWYGNYLTITTLALRRLHEYDADRRGAEFSSAESAADVLMSIDLAGYRLQKSLWPALLRESGENPLPPADVLSRIAQFFTSDPPADLLQRWRRREQQARTPIGAEHPCLADRLASLGCRQFLDDTARPMQTRIDSEDSAIGLLGDCRPRVWQVACATWKAMAIQRWRVQHDVAKRLRDIAATTTDAWKRIQLRAEYSPPDEAMKLLRDFLSEHPDHPAAHFALGQLLLECDDDSAAECFEKAMADKEFTRLSLQLLLNYYRELGRDEEAEVIRRRIAEGNP